VVGDGCVNRRRHFRRTHTAMMQADVDEIEQEQIRQRLAELTELMDKLEREIVRTRSMLR